MGIFSTPVERRPADETPRVSSGAFGGRMIDFRRFAARGVVLLGRAESAHDGVMAFSNDLVANIAHGDEGYSRLTGMIDTYISDNGLDVPEDVDTPPILPDPLCMTDPIRQLDMHGAGLGAVIWCTGYGYDLGWLDLPVLDEQGAPCHDKGVTSEAGLYFVGLRWLSAISSEFLVGVAEDSARLADHIVARAAATAAAAAACSSAC